MMKNKLLLLYYDKVRLELGWLLMPPSEEEGRELGLMLKLVALFHHPFLSVSGSFHCFTLSKLRFKSPVICQIKEK